MLDLIRNDINRFEATSGKTATVLIGKQSIKDLFGDCPIHESDYGDIKDGYFGSFSGNKIYRATFEYGYVVECNGIDE